MLRFFDNPQNGRAIRLAKKRPKHPTYPAACQDNGLFSATGKNLDDLIIYH
jgi:hypothetical protein